MALKRIAWAFDREEQSAGWPDAMSPYQLAMLQRPFTSCEQQERRQIEALREALRAACEAGEIAHDVQTRYRAARTDDTHLFRPIPLVDDRWQSGSDVGYWSDSGWSTHRHRSAVRRQEAYTVLMVPAGAFAAWLTAQDMEPSQHIAAWFKVHGVAAGGQDGAPAAPTMAAQDVTDWPSLVRYRRQFASVAKQQRPAWLPAHVALLAGQLQQAGEAGNGRGALGRLAVELGAVRSTVGELLKKHDYSTTTGEKQQPLATAWSGLGGRGAKAA